MEPLEKIEEYLQNEKKEIRVSINDMSYLLEHIYNLLATSTADIPEIEMKNITRIFNKYLVMSKLRKEEAQWYNVIKQLESGIMKELPADQKENTRRDVYEFYIDSKTKREQLQKELA